MNPDAILVRSANMLTMDLPASVKAIARAGAGYNNIPVPACSEKGVSCSIRRVQTPTA
jgi:D-3-phosphoglycerate dehydrogenase